MSSGRYTEPEFLPWDGQRVPVTLLGGYLGSGKTTLINQVLARATKPVAVLINDVGEINVDAGLVRRRSGDMIEFTDGCVCCSLSDGLGAAFDAIRSRPVPPEHLLLELSGLAEPGRVLPWTRSAGFRPDGVVITIDTDGVIDQVTNPIVGAAIEAQLQAADLVVLTKLDLVDDDTVAEVRHLLSTLAPDAMVVTPSSPLAGAGLLELGGGAHASFTAPVTLFDNHSVRTVTDLSFAASDELEAYLAGLDDDVVRVKGAVTTADGQRWLVQKVGRRHTVEPLLVSEYDQPDALVVIRLTADSRANGVPEARQVRPSES